MRDRIGIGENVLSLKEKLRRYHLIRQHLSKEGWAGLIVVSNAQIEQQGFVRYFTNFPIPIFSHGLIFLPDEEPFLFTPSPLQTFWAKRKSWIPKERIRMSKDFGNDLAAFLQTSRRGKGIWGVIHFKTLTARDFECLKERCPEAGWRDGTELLEEVRSQKSNEELRLVRRSAELAQVSHQIVDRLRRVGIRETELVSEVERSLRANGAERTFYLISSEPKAIYPYPPGDHILDGKSPLLFSVEVSGPGGYWTQMVRTFFWEKPKGDLMEMYQSLLEMRERCKEELRPGRRIGEVAENLRRLIQKRGFEFGIHFGHGLGLDVVEEPLIYLNSDRRLMPHQVITIHPHLVLKRRSLGVWMGDTYLVQERGAENLTPYFHEDF